MENENDNRKFTFSGLLEGIRSTFGFGTSKVVAVASGAQANVRVPIPTREVVQAKTRVSSGTARMQNSANKLAMWSNEFVHLVEGKLRQNFHPENFARMRLMVHSASNPLERVVRDISMTYDSPPTRSLESGDSEALTSTYQAINMDAVMETVEWLSHFLPCVWVRPFVRYAETVKDEATGEVRGKPESATLSLIIYTPDVADIVPDEDDPTVAAAFYYISTETDAEGRVVKRVNLWSPTEFVKLDEEWKVLLTQENPLGRLPVVPFRLGVPIRGNFYLDGVGNDLFEGTLELCVLKTIQNARARDSGFKQLVLAGADEESIPADQVMGGPTPLYTSEGGSATILDLQPNLEEWTNLCEKRGLELSAKYGISAAEYKSEGAPQSGFAKKLDRDKILKENRRVRKFFTSGEQELYSLIRATLEAQPVKDFSLPEGALVIDYAEPTFTEDPQTQATVDSVRIKLNIDSIVDILRRENPDLTDEQLLTLALEKKRINQAVISPESMSVLDILSGLKPETGTDNGGNGGSFP